MGFRTISEIQAANERLGHHWFEPGALRFFNSRVGCTVYASRYFVSSEQFDYTSPRLYTVRRANDDGSIDTVGEFQAYRTCAEARQAIKALPVE